MKFSKAGATLPPECNTEPLAGFQSVNFRLKTATSALISISSLLACSTDFGLASPYNCRSQFLKWNLPLYLFCWFCFSREPWLIQACCWSHCYRQLWLIIRKPLTFVCWEFTPEVLKFISGFSPQWLRLHLGLLPPWHFWAVCASLMRRFLLVFIGIREAQGTNAMGCSRALMEPSRTAFPMKGWRWLLAIPNLTVSVR